MTDVRELRSLGYSVSRVYTHGPALIQEPSFPTSPTTRAHAVGLRKEKPDSPTVAVLGAGPSTLTCSRGGCPIPHLERLQPEKFSGPTRHPPAWIQPAYPPRCPSVLLPSAPMPERLVRSPAKRGPHECYANGNHMATETFRDRPKGEFYVVILRPPPIRFLRREI